MHNQNYKKTWIIKFRQLYSEVHYWLGGNLMAFGQQGKGSSLGSDTYFIEYIFLKFGFVTTEGEGKIMSKGNNSMMEIMFLLL